MTNPRDEIDDWLAGEVEPLYPRSDALDRIRRRARRRKVNQATVAAAGCAVVLAAAVAVPQLVRGTSHPGRPVAGGATPASTQPSASQATTNSVTPSVHSSAAIQKPPQRTTLSNSWTIPPPGFKPTSVTFVGTGLNSVIGAVIGQAARPCSSQFCTSLAGTSDYGTSWYGVSAPYAPGPESSTGVSQLRFASLRHGWAFGPALYETTAGGSSWHPQSTGGQRVIDIEAAANGPALGLWGTCSVAGIAYATSCTSFSLHTSGPSGRTWTAVAVPAGTMSTGTAASAELVVTGTTGYVLAPTGVVLTGPVSGGTWRVAGQAPCAPGPAQRSGLPSQALLATSPQQLMIVCASGATGPTSVPTVSTSADGSAWHLVGPVPLSGSITSLASGANGQIVLATSVGIYQSSDGGKTWQQAKLGGAAPAGGFTFVGMTDARHGVAIPADSGLGEVYISTDGGLNWQPSPIKG